MPEIVRANWSALTCENTSLSEDEAEGDARIAAARKVARTLFLASAPTPGAADSDVTGLNLDRDPPSPICLSDVSCYRKGWLALKGGHSTCLTD